jgi:hypothetical protein
MKKNLLLGGLLIIICQVATAQKIDSVLNMYADNFQPEKIHLHFDKAAYNKGETIWYKAYIMAGVGLSEYSNNFYADWYDDKGKLLFHSAAPIYISSAKGQFIVPTNYNGEYIHIRAYTKWMQNFDSSVIFEKDIFINNKTQKTNTNKVFTTTLNLFPEGGDLIAGITTRIAFKAENQFGNPVYIKGAIKNNNNDLIDSFAAEHDGMGSFELESKSNETYYIDWIDEYGTKHSTAIPTAKTTGTAIEVETLEGKCLVLVKRTATVNDNYKTMYLVATMNQQMVYRSKINFTSRTAVSGDIPTTNLPSGILQITLFTEDWKPVAERIAFVNNNDYEFIPSIRPLVKGLEKRKKNVVEVNVGDTLLANMSIAITDAELPADKSDNIISRLLLSSELKGKINNAAYYFSSNADSVAHHLDLVMLTHGWRRYKWDDIIAGKLPTLIHQRDTDYLEIKGRVYGTAFERKNTNQTINVFVQQKDSSKQLIVIPINPDGSFAEKRMLFFDTVKLYYMFNGDRKLTDRAAVKFENGLFDPPRNNLKNLSLNNPTIDELSGQLRLKYFLDEQERLRKFMASTTLAEVTVRSKAKSNVDILDEKYASGLFSGGDGYQFDVGNDVFAQGQLDVFRYLQGKVAGLQINYNNGEPVLSWRGGNPSLFLDEIPSQSDMVINIPMSDIAYIKVFRPPFFGAIGGGSGGAIAVYTKKGTDGKRIYNSGPGLSTAVLGGYSSYKEFYSPNYEKQKFDEGPDVRTTLYWNPYLLTDKKNKTLDVEFYNNDVSKKFRVIVEGMNSDGKLARIEKIIE